MQKIIIAIDGYSSCGKSTLAKKIASKLKYIFIDTGAMYRAITLYAIQNGLLGNEKALVERLHDIDISFRFNPTRGASDIFINGTDSEDDIRSIQVSEHVSAISQIPAVREYLVGIQQKMGREKGVVMDGRDIGSVVFPDAELKIFMTADPEIRAMRRYEELHEKGEKVTLDQVRKNIQKRDHADINRAISPLKQAEDALILDNSYMSIDDEMDWVMEKIKKLTE